MAQNRCPLCGGKVVNGECVGCGYSLPDEGKLSAPYNLDPEDDRPEIFEPAPEKYEMPGVDMDSVGRYGAAPVKEKTAQNAPNIKVAPTINNNPAPQNTPQGWQNPYGNSPAQRNTPQRNSPQQNTPQNTSQQGWQNPYNYNPAQRPAPNNVNPTVHNNSSGKYILIMVVFLLLGFFSPIFAVIGLASASDSSMKDNLSTTVRAVFNVMFVIELCIYFFVRF